MGLLRCRNGGCYAVGATLVSSRMQGLGGIGGGGRERQFWLATVKPNRAGPMPGTGPALTAGKPQNKKSEASIWLASTFQSVMVLAGPLGG